MLTILQWKPSAESWECSKNIRFGSSKTCHTKQDETIETTQKQCQYHTPLSSSSSSSSHRQGKTRQGKPRQDRTRRDKGRYYETRQGKPRQDRTRQDKNAVNKWILLCLQDYSLRAKDHNRKKERITKMKLKAAFRNPDEYEGLLLSLCLFFSFLSCCCLLLSCWWVLYWPVLSRLALSSFSFIFGSCFVIVFALPLCLSLCLPLSCLYWCLLTAGITIKWIRRKRKMEFTSWNVKRSCRCPVYCPCSYPCPCPCLLLLFFASSFSLSVCLCLFVLPLPSLFFSYCHDVNPNSNPDPNLNHNPNPNPNPNPNSKPQS